ncbi:MAG: TIR domain-containing protein, partial [Anaerolineae bacterium]|nr:TIR domain-containing protein [Anaerolineae bacterium]
MPTDIRHDVFISYARKDAGLGAAPLDEALKPRYRVWRDIRGIDPTQDFTAEIEKAIKSSRQIVVCITPDVERADSFVRREIAYANLMNKPLLIARFADIVPPIMVVNHTWIDFFKGWEAAFVTLCRWLGGESIPSANPAPTPVALSDDPYHSYVEVLLDAVVDQIARSVLSDDIIALHTVSSTDDVPAPQHIWSLKTKYQRVDLIPQSEALALSESYTTLRQIVEDSACAGRVLLLGEPGAGKTTTLLNFARDAATARLNDPSQPLPFFEYIASWNAAGDVPLGQWLAAQNPGLSASALQTLIEQGQALLLLDGLDELGSRRPVDPKDPSKGVYDPRERFLKHLPPTGRVILSSRVEEYHQIGAQAALNCAVRL